MSVLQVTNVRSNSTSFNAPVVFQTSGGTENGQLVKVWVNFNGQGSVAIRADFNVNTVGDNGTGDYTVNFSNAMPDTNYAVSSAGTNDLTTGLRIATVRTNVAGSIATGSLRIYMQDAPGTTFHDMGTCYVTICR